MVKEYYGQAIKHPETEYKLIEKLEKCQEMIIITRQYSKLFRSRCTRIIQSPDAKCRTKICIQQIHTLIQTIPCERHIKCKNRTITQGNIKS